MTIKELVIFCGKSERSVRRWLRNAELAGKIPHDKTAEGSYDKVSQGVPIDYDIDQIEAILTSGSMSGDAVTILMENARGKRAVATPVQLGVDYEIIGKMIGMAVSAAMTPIVQELRQIGSGQLQIEQPKQDYFSLVGYCSMHKIKTTNSELRKMGMDLRKMTAKGGKELHKVPDERYGQVNSYPIEILDEYFTV